MLSMQELLNLRLGKLKAAIDDWEEVARRLKVLTNGEGGSVALKTRAEQASWEGVNATVSRKFVTKTASEFDDAVTTARSIHVILRDTHSVFIRHQDELSRAISDATKNNIYINDKGGAEPPSAPPGVAGEGSDADRPTKEQLAAAERNIARILKEADETDRIASRALRALAKNEHDFGKTFMQGVDDANLLQGEADAKYWAKKIAEGNVDDWSDKELERFNDVLAAQHDNPAFAERLTTELGATGTLKFWQELATSEFPGDVRGKILAHTQDSLGMTIATATHASSPEMESWKREMVAAGSTRFPGSGIPMVAPYGFQIMSSLMGKGEFDSGFLKSYGKKLVEFERSRGFGVPPWHGGENLSYPPSGEANDPLAGFLEALGHNSQASLEFFNASTGKGEDGALKELSNWDYLLSGDPYLGVSGVGGGGDARVPLWEDGKPIGKEALGHALESAAYGGPYDSDGPFPPHSAESSAFVYQLVDHFGGSPELLEKSALRESLGNITAEYMRDVQDGLNGKSEIKTVGENANLGSLNTGVLRDFLGGVGTDPRAYGAIINSQQAVTTELIHGALTDKDISETFREAAARSMSSPGGEIAGILAESRTQAVFDDRIASDKEFNESVVKESDKWTGRVINAAVGWIPVVGDVVGWGVEEASEAAVENYSRDSSEDANKEREDFRLKQLDSSAEAVYDAAKSSAIHAGMSEGEADVIASSVRDNMRYNYDLSVSLDQGPNQQPNLKEDQ
ncbi:DUF6571 family protein [Streptomyces sp. NBC_01304]|uniref:DUF6571 family protein n=1 Tax=Streptomyces sp. NBC_01304 TaxID=2903818 RepID=UPI002E125003|nr:hypothetical protein OG430_10950 [Streptomyces sp. NBC_01304]